jgi:hypothetical protein
MNAVNEGNPWDRYDEKRVREMSAAGHSLKRVAEVLGRSELSIGYRAYKLLGETQKKKSNLVTCAVHNCPLVTTVITVVTGHRTFCPECLVECVNANTWFSLSNKLMVPYDELVIWLRLLPGYLGCSEKLVYRDNAFVWVTKQSLPVEKCPIHHLPYIKIYRMDSTSSPFCPVCLVALVNGEYRLEQVALGLGIQVSDLREWFWTVPGHRAHMHQDLAYKDGGFSWVTKKPVIDEKQLVACINCGNDPMTVAKMFNVTFGQLNDRCSELGIFFTPMSMSVDFHWRLVDTHTGRTYILTKRTTR